ncbi:hypothetical protein [Bilifractor sp. HCP3S3_D3]|uniref:hypothetical protein n=1 Tax=Bilifractor sp. HCP3S3_D3 TaxID=3438907 RepID=UPI003F8BEE68
MKDLGIVQSTERPSDVDIRETKVFVASDIKEVHEKKTDEQPGFDGYSYNLKEYDKDEYIKSIQAKNAELEDETTQVQVALTEVYEMIGG